MAVKILVLGSSNGRIIDIINQINKLNTSKAGPFDLVILLGDVFPVETNYDDIEMVINGNVSSSIPVYFSDGLGLHTLVKEKIDPSNNELATNLIYLKPGQRITTLDGVSISTDGFEDHPSGEADPSNGTNKNTEQSSNSTNTSPIDILFTHQWPSNITQFTDGFLQSNQISYSKPIAQLVQKLKPKYHFVSTPKKNIFWERQPFYCNEEADVNEEKRITRFISLADFQTKDKKWFYAFKIDNSNLTIPKVITANPLSYISIPKGPQYTIPTNNWDDSFDKKRSQDYPDRNNRKQRKQLSQQQPIAINPENCFFCLSNPKIDKSLIASIGDDFYLALAKGPLISDQITSHLGCPGHVLIIPMSHVPTYKSLITEQESILLEKRKFEIALKQMYSEHDLSYVSFEINRNRGVHIHTQVIGIPQDRLHIVESTFLEEADNSGISLEKRDLSPDEEEYFKVTLPDNSTLISSINNRSRFDLQFGRRVLAIILGIEEQIDWKLCNQTTQEELKDCKEFKTKFKSYDFTL